MSHALSIMKRMPTLESYRFDMMTDEPSDIRAVRYIVSERLNARERRVLLEYAEAGNLRNAATALGCSHMTVARQMKAIRAKIKDIMKNIDKDDL